MKSLRFILVALGLAFGAGPAAAQWATPWDVQTPIAQTAKLNAPNQIQSGGANIVPYAIPSGSFTANAGNGAGQLYVNTGAFTVTAPPVTGGDGFAVIQVQNGPAAGAVTFSGWNVGANTGDAFGTSVRESASCTATNASPAVFTYAGHGLLNNWPLYLTGTTAPAGFSLNTQYYVTAKTTNTFQLSAAPGGAPINSSSTGSTLTCNADSVFNLQIQTIAGISTYAWKALQ